MAEVPSVDNQAPSLTKKERISKEIVESYIFSTVRHDFGIYSERLLLRLVELAQREIKGLDFKGGTSLGKVQIGSWGDAEITIPVKDILSGEDDKNYAKAKTAVKSLMGKFLEYEDDRNYRATHILNDVDVDKISGKMVIVVNRNIWSAMLDFSKGFRRYELETAVKLRGKYSLRIYKLVCTQQNPMSYTINELREMWGLKDKYKKVDDFVKNTILAAKEELDKVSPYSFDYALTSSKTSEINTKRKGRPSITSVTFFPKQIIENKASDAVRKMVDQSLLLEKETLDLLNNKFGFDQAGVKANISLFDIAQKEIDLFGFLQSIAPAALRAANVQGYVVNALKKHLSEKCGIVIDGSMILRGKSKTDTSTSSKSGVKSLKDILSPDLFQ